MAAAHPPSDLRWRERVPALILIVALLFVGFWPRSISDPINAALPPGWPAAGAMPSAHASPPTFAP